jgi:hypothetical protein
VEPRNAIAVYEVTPFIYAMQVSWDLHRYLW